MQFDLPKRLELTGRVAADAGNATEELFMYGEVGAWPLVPNNIRRELATFKGSKLTVRLHSVGGDVFQGMAIKSLLESLRQNGTRIDVVIDGLAASMATVIMLAGDTISARANAMLMIHNPWGRVEGDWEDLNQQADVLKKIRDQIAGFYADKTGIDLKKVEKLMKAETWMLPAEAKQNGFIDTVLTSRAMERIDSLETEGAYGVYAKMLRFKPLPESGSNDEQQPPNEGPTNHSKHSFEMDLKATAKTLGLSENASEQDVQAELERLRSQAKEADTLKAKAEAQAKARAEKLVAEAIADGRIQATEKDRWLKLANSDLELAENTLNSMQKKKTLSGFTRPGSTGHTGKAGEDPDSWSLMDWRKNDPQGLDKLQREEPDQFNALVAELRSDLVANGKYAG